MKLFNYFLTATVVIILCTTTALADPQQDGGKPFVLIELFTSEGCSSCPPADTNLIQITQAARQNNVRVFTLGFHVDYWDYLGWRDEFSSPQYTQRQRQYSGAFKTTSIYTPQMIINGTHQFGGYKRDVANRLISEYLTIQPKTALNLNIIKEGRDLTIDYTLKPLPNNTVIHFAIVERAIQTNVKRGENSGRQLAHSNVVRLFKTTPVKNTNDTVALTIPQDVNRKNASLIAYVQKKSDMTILGANTSDL